MKKQQNEPEYNNKVILKSGSSDLRRGEKSLIKLIVNNYHEGFRINYLYAFINDDNTAIKLVKKNTDDTIALMKLKREKAFTYPWPEYQPKGQEGYTKTLTDEEGSSFLKSIGCPENL